MIDGRNQEYELSQTANDTADGASAEYARIRPAIVFVTRNAQLAESVMNDAITIADRLDYRLVAAFVNTVPMLRDRERFVSSMEQSVTRFSALAAERQVEFSAVRDSGKLTGVIKRLCHTVKRVGFVLIDQEIKRESVASIAPVPVFSILVPGLKSGQPTLNNQPPFNHGETGMAVKQQKKRHVMKSVGFGALTLGLYASVFAMSDTVMHYWTMGGAYALLPVATVFVFSYAHGSFTSNFWSALGIEGSKVAAKKQAEKRAVATETKRPRQDKRPRLQA